MKDARDCANVFPVLCDERGRPFPRTANLPQLARGTQTCDLLFLRGRAIAPAGSCRGRSGLIKGPGLAGASSTRSEPLSPDTMSCELLAPYFTASAEMWACFGGREDFIVDENPPENPQCCVRQEQEAVDTAACCDAHCFPSDVSAAYISHCASGLWARRMTKCLRPFQLLSALDSFLSDSFLLFERKGVSFRKSLRVSVGVVVKQRGCVRSPRPEDVLEWRFK